jgi:hypothetical protein
MFSTYLFLYPVLNVVTFLQYLWYYVAKYNLYKVYDFNSSNKGGSKQYFFKPRFNNMFDGEGHLTGSNHGQTLLWTGFVGYHVIEDDILPFFLTSLILWWQWTVQAWILRHLL